MPHPLTPPNKPDLDIDTPRYFPATNRLHYVTDAVPSGNYQDDINNQSSGNYEYDLTGNLINDEAEEIALKPGWLFSFYLNKKKQKFKAVNNYWLF